MRCLMTQPKLMPKFYFIVFIHHIVYTHRRTLCGLTRTTALNQKGQWYHRRLLVFRSHKFFIYIYFRYIILWNLVRGILLHWIIRNHDSFEWCVCVHHYSNCFAKYSDWRFYDQCFLIASLSGHLQGFHGNFGTSNQLHEFWFHLLLTKIVSLSN